MVEPSWLKEARKDLGLREIPGAKHAPGILKMWALLKAPFTDDETPWCGGAAGAWFTRAGFAPPPLCWRARNWLEWGKPVREAVLGCVVVTSRPGGAGVAHVGIAVGRTHNGGIAIIAGNQGNAVTIAAFSPDRVLGMRVPVGDRQYDPLPLVNADGSQTEA